VPADRRALLGAAWDSRRLLLAEFDRLDPEDRAAILRRAFAAARPVLRRLSHWGAAHRLRLKHPLGWLPGLGRRFRFTDWPWPGGNDTVFKSAHAPVAGVHAAGYGSNARYIFDLSDPDANRLVILGGQDGVPGSAAFLDQAEMFRRGEYIDVPLRLQTARRRFRHVTMLGPE
jgi:penicillin amidase